MKKVILMMIPVLAFSAENSFDKLDITKAKKEALSRTVRAYRVLQNDFQSEFKNRDCKFNYTQNNKNHGALTCYVDDANDSGEYSEGARVFFGVYRNKGETFFHFDGLEKYEH